MDITYEIGLISLFALIFTIIFSKLKFSPIIGLIITGIIIGPKGLKLVSNEGYIKLFSDLGEILLLYYIGSKIDLKKINKIGIKPLLVWLTKGISVFVVIYLFTTIIGLSKENALIFSSIFMVSSTAFFAKITKEKQIIKRKESQLIFIVLLIEDLLSIFLLMFYSNVSNNIALSLIKAVLILVGIYFIFSKYIISLFKKIIDIKSNEIFLFFSLSLAILLSMVSKSLNLSPGIGAFLAGNLLASIKNKEKILDHLGLLFTSFFFLSIGMQINLTHVIDYLPMIIELTFIILITIFVSIFFSTYFLGFNSKQSTLSTTLMLSIGEFSLILAKEVSHLMTIDIVSIAGAIVLIGAFTENIGINNYEKINNIIEKRIPKGIRRFLKNISIYLGEVFKEIKKDNKEIRIIFEKIVIAIFIIAFLLFISSLNNLLTLFYVIIFSIYIIKKIIELFIEISKDFDKAMGKNKLDKQAMINAILIISLLILTFIYIILTDILNLNKIYICLTILPFFLILVLLYNLGKITKKIVEEKYGLSKISK